MNLATSIVPESAEIKLKSYWHRPGGKFGVVFGLAVIALVAYYVVPILLVMVWNTFNLAVALVCTALFIYCISRRKLRLSFYYFYEWLMKKLIGLVIELDPFIIAEDYLRDMIIQRETLYKKSIEVDTHKEKLVMKISEKQAEMEKLVARAQAAKDNNMMPELANATRQIGRIQEYIQQLSPIKENLGKISDYLIKIHKNSAYIIEDAKNELEMKKDLYRSVTSGNQALNSALKIFNGDPEKKLLVEQSMEHLKDDMAAKLANMKHAISLSSDFMRSIDLDNATYQQEGLKMLEKYNQEHSFDKTGDASRPASSGTAGMVDTSSYDDLLK
jgi:hypothetical protein